MRPAAAGPADPHRGRRGLGEAGDLRDQLRRPRRRRAYWGRPRAGPRPTWWPGWTSAARPGRTPCRSWRWTRARPTGPRSPRRSRTPGSSPTTSTSSAWPTRRSPTSAGGSPGICTTAAAEPLIRRGRRGGGCCAAGNGCGPISSPGCGTTWSTPIRPARSSPPGSPKRSSALLACARRGGHRHEISTRLHRFNTWCADSKLPELERLAGTIEAWWPEVEGFLQTGITNAGTEATNRTVKTAARTAYSDVGPGTVSMPSIALVNSICWLSMIARGSNEECAITPWMRRRCIPKFPAS